MWVSYYNDKYIEIWCHLGQWFYNDKYFIVLPIKSFWTVDLNSWHPQQDIEDNRQVTSIFPSTNVNDL